VKGAERIGREGEQPSGSVACSPHAEGSSLRRVGGPYALVTLRASVIWMARILCPGVADRNSASPPSGYKTASLAGKTLDHLTALGTTGVLDLHVDELVATRNLPDVAADPAVEAQAETAEGMEHQWAMRAPALTVSAPPQTCPAFYALKGGRVQYQCTDSTFCWIATMTPISSIAGSTSRTGRCQRSRPRAARQARAGMAYSPRRGS
jgi:hypothetical protein